MSVNIRSRVIVELEDHGQDFTEFHLVNGEIVETKPFQGWHWDGRIVINRSISVGDTLVLTSHENQEEYHLKYPVCAVRAVFEEVST